MSRNYSIVEYFSERDGYKCGYCKSPNTNFSRGMWAHILQVQDYQDLVDRGWRRSGKYCYKPTMDQTCCPMYTIRCEALNFKISKSQKKILKKMSKFLAGKLKRNDALSMELRQLHNDSDVAGTSHNLQQAQKAQEIASDINISLIHHIFDVNASDATVEPISLQPLNSESNIDTKTTAANISRMSMSRDCKPGIGLDLSKPPPKKAKLMRLERKQNKLLALGKSLREVNIMLEHGKKTITGKSLEELFHEESNAKNKLELKLIRTSPMSSEYANTAKQTYEIYKKYQMMIHNDSAEKITEEQYSRFLVDSPLQKSITTTKIGAKCTVTDVSIDRLSVLSGIEQSKMLTFIYNMINKKLFFHIKLVGVATKEFLETFEISARLYKKYQMAIHKDPVEECNEESFTDFLCKSPLQSWKPSNGPYQGYGSFHQQYWLNDELIAVGVIDILPFCVSSVYFFYDPAYSFLSLGTYGSLREIMFTKELNNTAPDLKYYYMGFYIHSCPKMRYKAAMHPSKLLCPETYIWCDMQKCLPKLDRTKYSRLNEDLDALDEDRNGDYSQVLILYNGRSMCYPIYKTQSNHTANDDDEIRDYVSLVGMKCARNLLLYRS